jgi:hypothetical protein
MLGRSPLVHRITNRRDRGFIIGVVILESDSPVRCRTTSAAPNRRAASRLTADLAGQVGEILQRPGTPGYGLDGGGTPELGYWPAAQ